MPTADLLIVNPNSSAHITHALGAAAARRLPWARTETWTLENAPPYIEGPAQLDTLLGGIRIALHAGVRPARVTLLGCFSGLDRGTGPAIPQGTLTLAEACFSLLALRGEAFSVITGGTCWQHPIEELAARMGCGALLRSVRATDANALEVLAGGAALREFEELLTTMAQEDGVSCVLLAGGGFVGHAATLAASSALRLLDCGEVAMAAVEALLALESTEAQAAPHWCGAA